MVPYENVLFMVQEIRIIPIIITTTTNTTRVVPNLRVLHLPPLPQCMAMVVLLLRAVMI